MTEKNNLELWERHCKTDADARNKYCKQTSKSKNGGGYKFTSINPQYQCYLATKEWGPYGSKWGLKGCKYGYVGNVQRQPGDDTPSEIWLEAIFFYPGGEFQISSDMGYRPNGESRKKLLTDCRSKALSLLGFCADIFYGAWDGLRYDEAKADPDNSKKSEPSPESEKANNGQFNEIKMLLDDLKMTWQEFCDGLKKKYKVEPNEMTTELADEIITNLIKKVGEK